MNTDPGMLTIGCVLMRQEPYRGRGMAKAVAVKVLKEHSFGDDGWGELRLLSQLALF